MLQDLLTGSKAVQLAFVLPKRSTEGCCLHPGQGGAHFGHLTRLRTLELDSQVGGAGAAGFNAQLAGLPPSLQRLTLQASPRAVPSSLPASVLS